MIIENPTDTYIQYELDLVDQAEGIKKSSNTESIVLPKNIK